MLVAETHDNKHVSLIVLTNVYTLHTLYIVIYGIYNISPCVLCIYKHKAMFPNE